MEDENNGKDADVSRISKINFDLQVCQATAYKMVRNQFENFNWVHPSIFYSQMEHIDKSLNNHFSLTNSVQQVQLLFNYQFRVE